MMMRLPAGKKQPPTATGQKHMCYLIDLGSVWMRANAGPEVGGALVLRKPPILVSLLSVARRRRTSRTPCSRGTLSVFPGL